MSRFHLGGLAGPGAWRGRVVRVAAVILTVWALALLAFFSVSPVRRSILALFHPAAIAQTPPGIRSLPPPTSNTPTPAATPRANPTPNVSAIVTVQATAAPGATTVPVPVSLSGDPRFAFLLLGYGGPGHDGPYLTDSMMLVIVDANQKTLTLLSIPRDSWVPLLFDGQNPVYSKINTAYAFAIDPTLYTNRLDKYTGTNGAGVFASDTVARLTGLPIDYYLSLDFAGFKDMIDAVGGIDVTVPDSFTALYPINDNPSINAGWTTVHFTKGPDHMDGVRALAFARAREVLDNPNEGSDFARSRRQRIIIEAFKNRVLQPAGLIHIPQLLAIANGHVSTNYAIPAAEKITQLALGWKDVRIYQTALTTDNYLEVATGPDGTFAEVPSSPSHSWLQVQGFANTLWEDPAAGVAMAQTPIDLVNESGNPNLGEAVSSFLIAHGYLVGNISSATPTDQSQLVAQVDDSNRPLVQRLAQDLKLPNLATTSDNATSGRFTLVLGGDAANLTFPRVSDNAPTSTVGILGYGSWDPSLANPTTGNAPTSPTPAEAASSPTPVPELLPTATPAEPSAPRATPIRSPKNPNLVLVPNLIGLSEATAQDIINNSDLMTTYVNYQTAAEVADKKFFNSVDPGAVLSQSPAPGTEVSPGTRVSLAVRK